MQDKPLRFVRQRAAMQLNRDQGTTFIVVTHNPAVVRAGETFEVCANLEGLLFQQLMVRLFRFAESEVAVS